MRVIHQKVEDFRRFIYRVENFLNDDAELLHTDTLKYYLQTLEKSIEPIQNEKLTDDEEIMLFQSRLSFCQQLLNTRIKSAPVTTAKISRTADLKARQLLLRGSAQRESRQREELLQSKPKQEKQLTLRQRRLLLLENDENDERENHNEKPNAESEKEAEELAKFTLQLTKQLKDIATGTRDIIKDDRSILKDMDSKMESNLANLVMATRKVEEHLKYGGGVQYFMLLVVFCVWVFMVIIISTVPKLNY